MEQQAGYRSGFAAIIGRPNVGKSTLMNHLVGEKVAIVSPRPQTTRNRIMGVLTRPGKQVVFLDTPGLHTPRTRLGESMMRAASEALEGADILLLMMDASDIKEQDRALLEKYQQMDIPKALLLNKIDLITREPLARVLDSFRDANVDAIIPISAVKERGLDRVESVILDWLPEGPQYFPDDMITDQPERFIIAEMIREKAMRNLRDEIPHGVGVEILEIAGQGDGLVTIHANLYCEKASHKGIIIGKQGAMLTTIGSLARADIERLLDEKVNLQLWVKVREDWRNRRGDLATLGYE